jgi:hypothetical protein
MPEIEATGVYDGKEYHLRVFTMTLPAREVDAENGTTADGPLYDPPLWCGEYAEVPDDGSDPMWLSTGIQRATPEEALQDLKYEIIVAREFRARLWPERE